MKTERRTPSFDQVEQTGGPYVHFTNAIGHPPPKAQQRPWDTREVPHETLATYPAVRDAFAASLWVTWLISAGLSGNLPQPSGKTQRRGRQPLPRAEITL